MKKIILQKADQERERKQKAKVIFPRIATEPGRSHGTAPGCGYLGWVMLSAGAAGFPGIASEQQLLLPLFYLSSGHAVTEASLAAGQHQAVFSGAEDEGDVRCGHKISTESSIRR